MTDSKRPLKWDPMTFARTDDDDLWCIVRWAIRDESDVFLCGPLESCANDSYVSYRGGAESLGYDTQGAGGLLALFESHEHVVEFMGKDGVTRGTSIAANHAIPLSALRFDVTSRNYHSGEVVSWGSDLRYFEALGQLGRASLLFRGRRSTGESRLDLAGSVRRKWTIEELKQAIDEGRGLLAEDWPREPELGTGLTGGLIFFPGKG